MRGIPPPLRLREALRLEARLSAGPLDEAIERFIADCLRLDSPVAAHAPKEGPSSILAARRHLDKARMGRQTDIAEALGVSDSSVSLWMRKAREGGKEALKTSPRPGRPPKLTEEQRSEELPSLLEKGPEHFGFRGDVWTRKRVREVIKEEFRVEYDVSQVGRILDQIGWSRQKPDHRSDKRDEEAIEEWKNQEWPRIKKSRD